MGQKTYEELVLENTKLLENIKIITQEINNKNIEIDNKNTEITDLKNTIENDKLLINQLQRYLFGSKSESLKKEENIVNGEQCSFFGIPEDEDMKKEIEEAIKTITYNRKKKNKKASGIKKSELKNIEIETYIENADDQTCPICGSNMKKIGKEFSRQEIQYIPAKFKIVNYYKNVYKCESCGTDESEKETPTIVKTHVPSAILSHSFASASLATEVIYQKYYMGVPLYRQEKVWDDRGLILPRNMSANWCIKISQYYLDNIYRLMLKQLKDSCEVLHMDETTMQCNHEPNRSATSNSYMWVIVSGDLEKKKGVIFNYSSSRAEKISKELLKGYNKILITDGYDGYNNLEVTRAECWAHCRRYFYESIPLDNSKKLIKTSDGYHGVELIDELFKIENDISDLKPDEKLKIRKEKSEPILKNFYEWVYLTSQKYITNKKLQKALTYATNQKNGLTQFMNDGRIPLTNSRSERAIRPFAVHRKNWLFADTVDGAKANAIYYSLIESAKINKLNIYKYINYLLEELPQLKGSKTEDEIEKYLPWSDKLPNEIRNFEGEYKDLEL